MVMNKKIEKLLNEQIENEYSSSHLYLSMASWADRHGFNGTAAFLYAQSDEEREHMLKLVKFINEREGTVIIPALDQPKINFKSLQDVFEALLDHEIKVTASINNIVGACLDERDYTTHNFIQWYVSEQLEEEAMARQKLDELTLIGDDKGGLYHFDRDMRHPMNE